jgi:hypothetical protein
MASYRHAIIENLPSNPKEIFDYALGKSYNFWVDEKGTIKNSDIWRRQPSDLSYEEAFSIIQKNKPHWVVSFRNVSHISNKDEDYWEFGGCNIASNDYGEVFIWIIVEPSEAIKIFEKFNLKIHEY